jgi:AbrB family looped-hinge helix DNA binding protein
MKSREQVGEEPAQAGFSVLDDKGRLSLPKSVRSALGLHSGSSLTYVLLGDAVLLIPQDAHLEQLQQQAIEALTEAGLRIQDLLDRLPQARDEVMREAYGPALLARLQHMRVEQETEHGSQPEVQSTDTDHALQGRRTE